jgi:hypothetical protein
MEPHAFSHRLPCMWLFRRVSLLVCALLLCTCTGGGGVSSRSTTLSVTAPASTTGEPPLPSVAPEILSVECRNRRLFADADAVTATAAGLRVRVHNATTRAMFLQFTQGSLGPWGGIELEPGTRTVAIQMPPGHATMRCYDGRGHATDEFDLRVREGAGRFVPYILDCKAGAQRLTPAAMKWASPHVEEDPLEAVLGAVKGIRAGDMIEVAGYPEAPNPTLRLVRHDRVLGAFDLKASGQTWAVSFAACSEAGIAPRRSSPTIASSP